jgi:hypothetical protein
MGFMLFCLCLWCILSGSCHGLWLRHPIANLFLNLVRYLVAHRVSLDLRAPMSRSARPVFMRYQIFLLPVFFMRFLVSCVISLGSLLVVFGSTPSRSWIFPARIFVLRHIDICLMSWFQLAGQVRDLFPPEMFSASVFFRRSFPRPKLAPARWFLGLSTKSFFLCSCLALCASTPVHCCFQPLLKALFVLLDFGFSLVQERSVFWFWWQFLSHWIKGSRFSSLVELLLCLNTPTRCSVKCVKASELLYLFDFACRSLTRGFARID